MLFGKAGVVAPIAAIGLSVGVLTAPAAHADEQTFVDALRENGWSASSFAGHPVAPGIIIRPDVAIAGGHDVCNQLQLGLTPDQLVATAIPPAQDNTRIFITAAQEHLC
ncbi:MAG: DUF732 domain-containing protein [Mycobacterium sp.]